MAHLIGKKRLFHGSIVMDHYSIGGTSDTTRFTAAGPMPAACDVAPPTWTCVLRLGDSRLTPLLVPAVVTDATLELKQVVVRKSLSFLARWSRRGNSAP